MDISDAYKWYEAQRKGLGENFLLCIEQALSKILRNPENFSVVYRDVRRAMIQRFPFGVFFVSRSGTLSVLAVLHARRHPNAWKSRA